MNFKRKDKGRNWIEVLQSNDSATWHHIPEDHNLNIQYNDNIISHTAPTLVWKWSLDVEDMGSKYNTGS
jgi:hypothetical protein